jgi:hypothetical protein
LRWHQHPPLILLGEPHRSTPDEPPANFLLPDKRPSFIGGALRLSCEVRQGVLRAFDKAITPGVPNFTLGLATFRDTVKLEQNANMGLKLNGSLSKLWF